jgi:hypothetical protein
MGCRGRQFFQLFRVSSVVEQWTVNPLVVGSNPTPGDLLRKSAGEQSQSLGFTLKIRKVERVLRSKTSNLSPGGAIPLSEAKKSPSFAGLLNAGFLHGGKRGERS